MGIDANYLFSKSYLMTEVEKLKITKTSTSIGYPSNWKPQTTWFVTSVNAIATYNATIANEVTDTTMASVARRQYMVFFKLYVFLTYK